MKILELDNVSFAYDDNYILEDANLCIDYGDFVAVTGPNGGGKTTLLKLLLRLLEPTSGKVIYYGKSGEVVTRLPIGYLPQKSQIDTAFPITASEVVKQGQLKGFFRRETPAMVKDYREVVELCGLGEFENQTIRSLSGGQLQRTLLARAIVSKPELLVLDEPLSYVDKRFEQQIYHIVEELSHTTTIVLVSHEMTVISRLANRHITVNRSICS